MGHVPTASPPEHPCVPPQNGLFHSEDSAVPRSGRKPLEPKGLAGLGRGADSSPWKNRLLGGGKDLSGDDGGGPARAAAAGDDGGGPAPRAAADLLVIGGGIVGLTVALEAKRRDRGLRVVVLEKEAEVALHASGRNSGVLHAGLYYPPGSLKARFARDGCARLTEYCLERGLAIRRCGKLIVPTSPGQAAVLDELLRRGRANGVELHEVDRSGARELDPAARVEERALWVPATASVDPAAVTRALAADARAAGVELRTGEAFAGWKDGVVLTRRGGAVGAWSAGYVINAAGVHADTVARAFGFGAGYRIMPFMGRYLRATVPVAVTRHIYPVPDLRYPFLGVHFTVAVDGSVWIGPTATPVLGRERYGDAGFDVDAGPVAGPGFDADAGPVAGDRLRPGEAVSGALALARLLGAPGNAPLRRLAVLELRRKSRRALLREAGRLARDLPPARAWAPGRPGIRAQLVDTRRWKLEDDFVYQSDDRSLHVLNAVSPAFTSAFPLAEHLLDLVTGA